MRDIRMDAFKTLLVFGMVFCHVLQFFVNLNENPTAEAITGYVNVITFSGFVFTFGYTTYLAYYERPFQVSFKKMLLTSLKILVAYYLSGFAFRLWVNRLPLNQQLTVGILTFQDIPGWSEFIVSFAIYIFLAAILMIPIKALLSRKILSLIIMALLLMTTFIPYDQVAYNPLGLLIGSRNFASFPVLQYAPWFLMGMYVKKYEVKISIGTVLPAVVLTGIGVTHIILNDFSLPERFPPSLYWIILPALPIYCYFVIGNHLAAYKRIHPLIIHVGANTILYLLVSNIVIFSLSGAGGIRNISLGHAGLLTIAILGIIGYLLSLVRTVPRLS